MVGDVTRLCGTVRRVHGCRQHTPLFPFGVRETRLDLNHYRAHGVRAQAMDSYLFPPHPPRTHNLPKQNFNKSAVFRSMPTIKNVSKKTPKTNFNHNKQISKVEKRKI